MGRLRSNTVCSQCVRSAAGEVDSLVPPGKPRSNHPTRPCRLPSFEARKSKGTEKFRRKSGLSERKSKVVECAGATRLLGSTVVTIGLENCASTAPCQAGRRLMPWNDVCFQNEFFWMRYCNLPEYRLEKSTQKSRLVMEPFCRIGVCVFRFNGF
eukprot:TRINITY_DN25972_c0_g1_i5.p1 TRINITY_DN25972_c0_g1~~TRINITY_DN25972_c0_g1_i5.p1  ORF type:complete len:155 (-),score=0.95 TRINITY_DN25972_c0_g1_i5:6-470(-)